MLSHLDLVLMSLLLEHCGILSASAKPRRPALESHGRGAQSRTLGPEATQVGGLGREGMCLSGLSLSRPLFMVLYAKEALAILAGLRRT